MRNDHVECGWGVPVEYEFFLNKVCHRIYNQRSYHKRVSAKADSNNRSTSRASEGKGHPRSVKGRDNKGGDNTEAGDEDGDEGEQENIAPSSSAAAAAAACSPLARRTNKKRKTHAPKDTSAAAAAYTPPSGRASKKRKTGDAKGSAKVRHTAHDTAGKGWD